MASRGRCAKGEERAVVEAWSWAMDGTGALPACADRSRDRGVKKRLTVEQIYSW